MYILFEMVDQKQLGPIEIKGRWLEYCVGFIPDTHTEIIPWNHLNATVLSDAAGQAWMFTDGWTGQISVRAGTPPDEQLQVHESTEDLSVKVKYDISAEQTAACVEFMKAVMRQKLDKVFDSRLRNTNLPPSKLEGESWAQQKEEAQAGGGPMLQALATARGITEAEMVIKVLTAIDNFNTNVQNLLSDKQALEQTIKSCTTMADCWVLLHTRFNLHAPIGLLQERGITDAPAYNLNV